MEEKEKVKEKEELLSNGEFEDDIEYLDHEVEDDSIEDTSVEETPSREVDNTPYKEEKNHYGREAYTKTLDNKNYYQDEAAKLEKKQAAAKDARERIRKEEENERKGTNSSNEKKNSGKNTTGNDNKEKINKAESGNKKEKLGTPNKNNNNSKPSEKMDRVNKSISDTNKKLKANNQEKMKSKMFSIAHPIEAAKMRLKNQLAATFVRALASHPYVIAVLLIPVFIGIALAIFIILLASTSLSDNYTGTSGDYYATTGNGYEYNGNIVEYIAVFEGNTKACTTSSGVAGYVGADLGDGTITVGPGITNYALGGATTSAYIKENNWSSYFRSKSDGTFSISVGDCVPTDVLYGIKIYILEVSYKQPILNAMAKYDIKLYEHQIDALTSFNYNVGSAYSEKLVLAYRDGGYEGLWAFMKQFQYASGKVYTGLQKRRKAEFALFVTGDYTDQGLFYSRTISNYDYYDSEGVMAREFIYSPTSTTNGFIYPVSATTKCSSAYGYRWLYGEYQMHIGLDLAISSSPSILAAKSGKVIIATYHSSYGNYVKIQHDDDTTTLYAHMKSKNVEVGDVVTQGQVLGIMGTTGNSTGDHLHIEVAISGTRVDPADYLPLDGNVTNIDGCKR